MPFLRTFSSLVARSGIAAALLVPLLTATETFAEPDTLSIPVRWCVIGDDANDNAQADAGEEGAPAFTDPGAVGEPDTDNVLWRRHERISDNVFIPQADLTLRSSLRNIVDADMLHFPIIPDQDTSVGEVGDILRTSIDDTEWDQTYNACVEAWSEELDIDDLGIVAIVARAIVDEDGNGFDVFATGWFGARRVLLEDNAWSLPGSTFMNSAVGDPVDKTFGHEVGHTLPTEESSVTDTSGLRHTCENTNLMRQGRRDSDGDDLLDNFNLSDSIDQVTNDGADGIDCNDDDTTETVDQIVAVSEAAAEVPGCKIFGTNDDCSALSDVRTDEFQDVPAGEEMLDISTLTITQTDAGETAFVHEISAPIDLSLAGNETLSYYVLADLDGDAGTGGAPSDLGIPTAFTGAELVTKVEVSRGPLGEFLSVSGNAWRFEGGVFVEVSPTDVAARRVRLIAVSDTAPGFEAETHTGDQLVLTIPTDVRGPVAADSRLQGIAAGDGVVVDMLDERAAEPGLGYRLESPTFPVCSVTPSPVGAGQIANVDVSGLVPFRTVNVVFGDELLTTGMTDGDGAASVEFTVPADAREGTNLMTVGVDGTGLTADCPVEVTSPPPNRDPVAVAGPDQTLECASPEGTTVTLDGSGSSDPDGDPLTFTWADSFGTATGEVVNVTMPLGTQTVELMVDDGKGGMDTDFTVVTVEDTLAPEISALEVDQEVLWPPNHKMKPVSVTAEVADRCDAEPLCRITGISSDEPVDDGGDGETAPDWEITGDLSALLRAERSGGGDGREYTLNVQCTDASGNASADVVTVSVPHDQRGRSGKGGRP